MTEHVDGVRIQLAGGVSWHVEVADNDKSGAENDDLVEHVRQLVGERRRDGSRRSVDTDNDRRLGATTGELDSQQLELGVVNSFMFVLVVVSISLLAKFEQHSFTDSKDMTGAQKFDNKLSYRRGTAQHCMLVSSCYVSRGMAVRKVSDSKSDLQGHWQWCHLVGHK